jgi:mannose-1-phosphate guanylyltransferase
LDESFLVINGDVLTDLSISDFVQTHRNRGGLITVATAVRKTKMDFGVMEQIGGRIKSFREKPILTNLMSMGVYCMEPEVLDHIPFGVPFGFDDLILRMLARDLPTYAFVHDGLWLDIGRIEDFQSAQELAWDSQAPAFHVVAAA